MAIDSLHLKLCHWVERLSRIKAFDVFYSDVLNFLRVDLIPHHNRSEQRAPKTNRKSTRRAMVSHRLAAYPEVRERECHLCFMAASGAGDLAGLQHA